MQKRGADTMGLKAVLVDRLYALMVKEQTKVFHDSQQQPEAQPEAQPAQLEGNDQPEEDKQHGTVVEMDGKELESEKASEEAASGPDETELYLGKLKVRLTQGAIMS